MIWGYPHFRKPPCGTFGSFGHFGSARASPRVPYLSGDFARNLTCETHHGHLAQQNLVADSVLLLTVVGCVCHDQKMIYGVV